MTGTKLLIVLTSDPDGPVVRHRWLAYRDAFGAAGIVMQIAPWPKDRAVRAASIRQCASGDAVVVSSRLLARRDVLTVRRHAHRLLFDFDDALPFRDTARGAARSATRWRRFKAIVRRADAVTCGNAYLRSLAIRAGKPGLILPTTVDMTHEPWRPEPPMDVPILGWIGSSVTMPYLEARSLVLSAIVASGRPVKLRAIADVAPDMPPGIAVDFVPWQLDTWRHHLTDIHIGLAPLPDDPWTRGKCGLRVLQMMAVGRPVVAAAVGVQAEQVVEGETGFLVGDHEELLTGILTLMRDEALRERMGREGQRVVRERWSVQAWSDRVVDTVAALWDD